MTVFNNDIAAALADSPELLDRWNLVRRLQELLAALRASSPAPAASSTTHTSGGAGDQASAASTASPKAQVTATSGVHSAASSTASSGTSQAQVTTTPGVHSAASSTARSGTSQAQVTTTSGVRSAASSTARSGTSQARVTTTSESRSTPQARVTTTSGVHSAASSTARSGTSQARVTTTSGVHRAANRAANRVASSAVNKVGTATPALMRPAHSATSTGAERYGNGAAARPPSSTSAPLPLLPELYVMTHLCCAVPVSGVGVMPSDNFCAFKRQCHPYAVPVCRCTHAVDSGGHRSAL